MILVEDLDRASSDYGELGFTLTPGGEHADALTPFREDSYLELVAFLGPSDERDNFWNWRPPH